MILFIFFLLSVRHLVYFFFCHPLYVSFFKNHLYGSSTDIVIVVAATASSIARAAFICHENSFIRSLRMCDVFS